MAMTATSTDNTAPTAAPADDPVLLPPGTISQWAVVNLNTDREDHYNTCCLSSRTVGLTGWKSTSGLRVSWGGRVG